MGLRQLGACPLHQPLELCPRTTLSSWLNMLQNVPRVSPLSVAVLKLGGFNTTVLREASSGLTQSLTRAVTIAPNPEDGGLGLLL